VGVDPAEQLLADLAQAGRERRRHYKKRKGRSCGPKLKNKKIRMKILHCFIAGLVRLSPENLTAERLF
jgi:hypothetical protein